MKFFAFAFLLISVGVVNANVSVKTSRTLEEDVDDFLDLIPTEELIGILFKYLNDGQVQKTITYMFGNEFKDIIAELDSIDEFNAVVEYLDNAGIGVSTFFNNLKEILGITLKNLQELHKISAKPIADLGGWSSMWREMSETVDWDAMRELWDDKMETSEDWQKFISDLTSDELKVLWTAMVEQPRMREISAMLTAGGVDVAGLYRLLKVFFGLTGAPPTTVIY